MEFGILALTFSAIFAGAAIYINIAEHPARLGLDIEPLLTQWKPSYKKGLAMQSGLAIISSLFGILAYVEFKDPALLIGSILILANWPFTLVVIMPVNKTLMAMDPKKPGKEARELLEKWGKLHAIRSALGTAATLSFIIAFLY